MLSPVSAMVTINCSRSTSEKDGVVGYTLVSFPGRFSPI